MPASDYKDHRVRDLAWALGSPPLLQRQDGDIHWVENTWFRDVLERFEPELRRLDEVPEPLHRCLDSRRDARLGHYFETLWRYWLENNGRFRLVQANLQVQDGNRTVGEFDFIVRDEATGKTLHWEIALKFYLGCNDTTTPANWWGPMRRDRLDIKTTRLVQHQARLCEQPATRALLSSLGLEICETWIILKGRLFYPLDRAKAPPNKSHPLHLQGFWLTASQIHQLDPTASWQLLEKPRWLAPLVTPESSSLTRAELADWWHATRPAHPVCIADIRDEKENARGFIVPDDWARSDV